MHSAEFSARIINRTCRLISTESGHVIHWEVGDTDSGRTALYRSTQLCATAQAAWQAAFTQLDRRVAAYRAQEVA